MSTIKLSTVYQLVLTSLLLGACLGILSRQVPLSFSANFPTVRAMVLEEPLSASTATPQVLVGSQLVNLRSAPALSAQVVGQAHIGQVLQVLGRDASNSWWLVCCTDGQPVWISAHVVTVFGDVADIAVIPTPTASAGQPPERTALAPAGLDNTVDLLALPVAAANEDKRVVDHWPYQLVQQQQYGEQITPRIFLYVSTSAKQGQAEGMADLRLVVKKDGLLLPTPGRTHGGPPDFTWPLASTRQHLANLKVEFPNIDPAGHWEIQLVDALGQAVGPVADFTLRANEPNMEMYLHYQK